MIDEVNYRNLRFAVYNDRDHFISSIIRNNQDWEGDQLDFIIQNIADTNRNMLDVGGDIGSYSVILSKYFNTVHCFEPHIDHYNIINHNIALNGITNVITYNSACSDAAGKCVMETVHKNQVKKSDDGEVDVVVLDDVIEDPIHFLKIDVEGHEYEVLKGAEKLIKRSYPDIYLETHPTIVADSTKNCEEFLTNLGYTAIVIYTDGDKFWRKL